MRTINAISDKQILHAILETSSIAECLRILIDDNKSINQHVSLSWICKKIGLSSKGNLADVLAGRRKLSKKYREPLLDTLGICGIFKSYLLKWFELSFDFQRRTQYFLSKKTELEQELIVLKKAIKIHFSDVAEEFSWTLALIFAALGLFANGASEEELIGYFGKKYTYEILSSLKGLQNLEFIVFKNGKYLPNKNQVIFQGNSKNQEILKSIAKDQLLKTREAIDHHFNSPLAFFEHSVISVKRTTYESELYKFKENLLKFQSKIEQEHRADLLVSLNISLYPSTFSSAHKT